MSEIPSPTLRELHEKAQAEFQNYADVEIVSTYGLPQAEYAVIHKSLGKIDFPQRGVIRATGKDRVDFLNKFITNQLIKRETKQPISTGQGCYAFLLNGKGRIIADMNVIERPDHTLLETDARNIPAILTHLQKFVFSEKVEFASLSGQVRELAIHGPKSLETLRIIAPEFPDLPVLSSATLHIANVEIIVFRDDPCGVTGYHLLVSETSAAAVWAELEARQIRSVGWAAFNSVRVEAGRPFFGIDFDDTVLPAETGQLDRAVSFTKGCYLGQEIIARMQARGQAARQIVAIRMKTDHLPLSGSPILDSTQNQVGIITSSTISPILSNSAIALGMVKKQFVTVGSEIQIPAEGALRTATVVELPFVRSEKP